MKMTIELLIAAIVVLIVALVVLTMFGVGIKPVTSVANARNICMQQAASACVSVNNGGVPSSVGLYELNVEGATRRCSEYLGTCTCSAGQLVC